MKSGSFFKIVHWRASFLCFVELTRALLFRCSPVGAAQVPDPGVATTNVSRIIDQHAPRVSLFFHCSSFPRCADFLFFARFDARVGAARVSTRSRPDSARVVAASERATNDQRCGAPFFLYFFLVVIRSTVVLPTMFCVFGEILETGAHHDDPFCRVDRPRHDNDARC